MRSAALVVLLGLPVLAQERLEIEGPAPATVRLGDTADVTIRVVGRGANPNRPAPPAVDGLEMGLVGPMSSQQMRVVNGQVSTTVSVEYTLRLRPTREGQFVVPAFALRTGTREQTVHELRLTAVKDLRGGDLGFIDMEVEPRRVYVHEPIRVRARFGIDPGFRLAEGFADRRRYLDIEVQSQWFDELPGAEPIAVSEPRGDVRWVVVNGRGPFAATFDGSHVRDGKTWQSFAIERAFLPTRIGRIELPAPTLRYDVLRSNSRAFGRTASENLYTYGEPVSLEVLPIPEKGRPTPYYGAVGRFTLDAALDRDTVTVGNSVKLQLTVRGQGNLEFLRLPELDDLAGFHKLGAAEARRDAEKVVVTYDLTPLSADVREVPAIHWNYFDTTPGVEKFVETAT
ncbi:MAG: BatD family protein, partial [Planctomycetes bacterium]|nr:BatD family protein [Planctomycetota bacterium]